MTSIQLFAFITGIVFGIAALLDMAMNGARNADFAGWGLGVVAACAGIYQLVEWMQ